MTAGVKTQLVPDRGERLLAANRRVASDLLGPAHISTFMEVMPCRPMQRLLKRARRVARTDLPVLIRGERGAAASLLAGLIHEWSPRASEPLVPFLAWHWESGNVEQELFGGRPADHGGHRRGRAVLAHRGTLYIDAVERLDASSQGALVRLLEETAEAASDDKKLDVRVIASSAAPLEAMAERGRFDAELLEALSMVALDMPRLRDQREDIPAVANAYLALMAERQGVDALALSEEAEQALMSHAWPGNLLELCGVLDDAVQRGDAARERLGEDRLESDRLDIDPASLRAPELDDAPEPFKVKGFPKLADLERSYIEAVLRRTGGKIYGQGGAAELLGLKPSTLQSRMTKLKVRRPEKTR